MSSPKVHQKPVMPKHKDTQFVMEGFAELGSKAEANNALIKKLLIEVQSLIKQKAAADSIQSYLTSEAPSTTNASDTSTTDNATVKVAVSDGRKSTSTFVRNYNATTQVIADVAREDCVEMTTMEKTEDDAEASAKPVFEDNDDVMTTPNFVNDVQSPTEVPREDSNKAMTTEKPEDIAKGTAELARENSAKVKTIGKAKDDIKNTTEVSLENSAEVTTTDQLEDDIKSTLGVAREDSTEKIITEEITEVLADETEFDPTQSENQTRFSDERVTTIAWSTIELHSNTVTTEGTHEDQTEEGTRISKSTGVAVDAGSVMTKSGEMLHEDNNAKTSTDVPQMSNAVNGINATESKKK